MCYLKILKKNRKLQDDFEINESSAAQLFKIRGNTHL